MPSKLICSIWSLVAVPLVCTNLLSTSAFAAGSLPGRNVLLSAPAPLVVEVGKKYKGKGKKAHKHGGKYKGGHHGKYKGNRHIRHWSHKHHYGDFVAGVALGTILGVAVAGIAPRPPSSELFWYWTDHSMSRGYWDYCY